MTTRREGQEWLTLAYDKGYRDGQAETPIVRCKTLARWIIGPVYWQRDAKALRAAYMLGHSIGGEEAREEMENDDATSTL